MRPSANQIRDNALNDPGYWVEEINGQLYDAIVRYMEENNFKRKDLAKHLGISNGRVSQILNNGEINFSLEKIISLSLKVDRIPVIRFEKKFPEPDSVDYNSWSIFTNDDNMAFLQPEGVSERCKTIPLHPQQEISINPPLVSESKIIQLHSDQKHAISHS